MMPQTSPALGAALNTKEAAAYLGLSVSLLTKLRCRGTGPAFVRAGERLVKYRTADLQAWMDARLVTSTSQQVAA